MNEYKRIIAGYLGIVVGEIAYYGSEGFTNGLGEIVAHVTVVIGGEDAPFLDQHGD